MWLAPLVSRFNRGRVAPRAGVVLVNQNHSLTSTTPVEAGTSTFPSSAEEGSFDLKSGCRIHRSRDG